MRNVFLVILFLVYVYFRLFMLYLCKKIRRRVCICLLILDLYKN